MTLPEHHSTNNKTVDIEMCVHRTTDRAVLVSDDGLEGNAVWLPLSLIEMQKRRDKDGRTYALVTLPVWKAEKEGLI